MHPLITAIREHARQHPAKAALRWKCNDYPYAALEAMIDTRARALQLKGIRAGDTVAFDAAACLDALVDTAALWTLGASAAPFSADAAGTLAGKAIRSGSAGFMHPGGDYIKTVAPDLPTSSANATKTASMVFPPGSTCAGGSAAWLHDETLHDLVQRMEKRFDLSARTILGLSTVDQHRSLLDVWAPLATGSTVDLLPDHESLQSASLLQHFRETEADLVVADPAFYRHLATAREALFPQFRDVIVTGHPDSHTRTAMADAFPCALFHLTDDLAGEGSIHDYCPAEFTGEPLSALGSGQISPEPDNYQPKETIMRKAVIPAAGLGTRFLPATKAMPKEMLPVVDKPAIQYVVEEAVRAGLTDIVMITGRNKRALEDHFDREPFLEQTLEAKGDHVKLASVRESSTLADLHYLRQGDPKGLGHAVLRAKAHVGNEPFAVLLGDDLIDEQDGILSEMARVQALTGGSVVALMEVEPEQISAYGCADVHPESVDGALSIRGLVEKPEPARAPSNLAVIGRYVLHPRVFDVLEQTPPGRGDEIQLTDALQTLAVSEGEGSGVYGVVFRGRRYDTGDKLSYLKAVFTLALEREDTGPGLRHWMEEIIASRAPQASSTSA